MSKKDKYTLVTVESYPRSFDTHHFYIQKQSHLQIGDVITSNGGHQYRIIDGKTHVDFEDIDLSIYKKFE